jgi:hypothetical protein
MPTVTVKEFAGPRTLALDSDQEFLFLTELRRVRRAFKAQSGVPHLIAPDCLITISGKKKPKTYGLYGQAILMDERTRKKWQFYFGVLLLEWLYR